MHDHRQQTLRITTTTPTTLKRMEESQTAGVADHHHDDHHTQAHGRVKLCHNSNQERGLCHMKATTHTAAHATTVR